MTLSSLLFGKNGLEKYQLFEQRVTEFFTVSRQYRTSSRAGQMVVMVDESADTYEKIMEVFTACKTSLQVFHFDQFENAVDFFDNVGARAIKCVIVDAGIIFRQNGNVLRRLTARYPNVPVLVKGCDVQQVKALKEYYRIAVVGREAGLSEIFSSLGLQVVPC